MIKTVKKKKKATPHVSSSWQKKNQQDHMCDRIISLKDQLKLEKDNAEAPHAFNF